MFPSQRRRHLRALDVIQLRPDVLGRGTIGDQRRRPSLQRGRITDTVRPEKPPTPRAGPMVSRSITRRSRGNTGTVNATFRDPLDASTSA
jgi:hypothetical protein